MKKFREFCVIVALVILEIGALFVETVRRGWRWITGAAVIALALGIFAAGCCWPHSLGGSADCDPKPEISFWSNVAGTLGNIFVPGTGEFWSATATAGLGALYGTAKVAHKRGHKKGLAAAKTKSASIPDYPAMPLAAGDISAAPSDPASIAQAAAESAPPPKPQPGVSVIGAP